MGLLHFVAVAFLFYGEIRFLKQKSFMEKGTSGSVGKFIYVIRTTWAGNPGIRIFPCIMGAKALFSYQLSPEVGETCNLLRFRVL